jgi:hypothetical protein
MVLAAVSPMLNHSLTNSLDEEVEIVICSATSQDITFLGMAMEEKSNFLYMSVSGVP